MQIIPNKKALHHSIFGDKNLFNKKSELVNKCRHQNKLLLSNVKTNDTMD